MTETDLKAHAADLRGMNASSDYRTFRKAADALDAAAARLETQSRALTTSQEAIDTLREENERLRKALEPFAFLDDESTQEAWEIRYRDRFKDWIDFGDMDRARAALNAKRPAVHPTGRE